MNAINILVTLDHGYIGPLCVMLRSLCESNPGAHLRVFVAHSSLDESDFKKMDEAVDGKCVIENTYVPCDKFPNLPCSERWPKEACYRIFAAHILPDDLDRVLYLDPDIVVINNIEKLYNMVLDGMCFAACTHMFEPMQVFSRARLKMPAQSVYINSGMLLMDLQLLRKQQKIEPVLDYYTNNKKRIYLFDQDIINGYYCEQTLLINPLLYNLDERYFKLHNMNPRSKANIINYDWVKNNTVIIHFCGKKKPWKEGYKGKFGELFYDPYAEILNDCRPEAESALT
jgi:lipopolysaccharide biosynthesis glycosyltransferase